MMRVMPAGEFAFARAVEYGTAAQNETVKGIIDGVRNEGDRAVRRFTEQFDRVTLGEFRVAEEQLQEAYARIEPGFLEALRQAAHNIREFHEKQKRNTWMDTQPNGSIVGQIVRPLQRVGVYVPGGKAAYPSSVLMNVIPAQAAGVPEIVMATPPASSGKEGIDPHILVAAAEAGVKEIYRIGGAQAVAALAYGTESIRPVDKIVGPGNIYVALAKRYVFGVVDIDSIAGPSEIVVLADDTADPEYAAADLLSQAEHDEMASAILVTTSARLAEAVRAELEKQLTTLPRRDIALKSIENHGVILLVNDIDEGIHVINRLAPEHLELMLDSPLDYVGHIHNAGAIFVGSYSAESVGDYFAGPNHILPTNGTARFSSPLNVDDFIKKSSLIYYSKQALFDGGDAIMTLARHEGLEGHARAVEIRLRKEGKGNG